MDRHPPDQPEGSYEIRAFPGTRINPDEIDPASGTGETKFPELFVPRKHRFCRFAFGKAGPGIEEHLAQVGMVRSDLQLQPVRRQGEPRKVSPEDENNEQEKSDSAGDRIHDGFLPPPVTGRGPFPSRSGSGRTIGR